MQFTEASKFIFNNVDLTSRFNLMIVRDTSENTKMVGLNRTLSTEGGMVGGNPLVTKVVNTANVFEVKVAKIINNKVIELNTFELEEIKRMLFINRVASLCVKDLNHYGVFKADFLNYDKRGILSLSFEMATPYAYTHPLLTTIRVVNTTKSVEVINRSNIDERLYFDIKLETRAKGNITIKNTRTDEVMEIKDVEPNQTICIVSEPNREIYNEANENENVYSRFTYVDFPNLVYGSNVFEITSNVDSTVQFIIQEPRVI